MEVSAAILGAHVRLAVVVSLIEPRSVARLSLIVPDRRVLALEVATLVIRAARGDVFDGCQ